MKKFIKIISVLSFLLILFSSMSLATDINMNLASQTNQQNSNTVTNQTGKVFSNSIGSSTVDTSSTTVTSTTSNQEEALGITNIINIILIAVRNCFNITCYCNINSLTLIFYKRYIIKILYIFYFFSLSYFHFFG